MDHIESPAMGSKKVGGMFRKGQESSIREGIIQVLSTDPYLREEMARLMLSDSKTLKAVILDVVRTDKAFRDELAKAITECNTTLPSPSGGSEKK